MVKFESCFQRENGDAVTLKEATIRLFDVDQKKRAWQMGPEVMQFWCPGGTFSLFGRAPTPQDPASTLGTHPYVSYNVGDPILEEPKFTTNGLTKRTWACPKDEPVTIWSKRTGDAMDNPLTSNSDSHNLKQETSTVEVNYQHVSCFDFTMANLCLPSPLGSFVLSPPYPRAQLPSTPLARKLRFELDLLDVASRRNITS